jgi:hypothetical protein
MLVESNKDDIEFLKDNLENSTTANSKINNNEPLLI